MKASSSSSSSRAQLLLVALVAVARASRLAQLAAEPQPQAADESPHQPQQLDPSGYFEQRALLANFNNKLTVDEYLHYALRSIYLVAGTDTDVHRYDARNQLLASFARRNASAQPAAAPQLHPSERLLLAGASEATLLENERNQLECGHQLDLLLGGARELLQNSSTFAGSRRLDLVEFLDSFGAPGSQLLAGNSLWLGAPQQCEAAKVKLGQQLVETRWCVAKYQSSGWPTLRLPVELAPPGGEALKLGVCLPRACNSLSIFRLGHKIDALVKLAKLNQVPYSSYQLAHLFCPPDEDSPLRQFSVSAKLFVLLLSSWLTLVLYFSLKFEWLRMSWLRKNGAQTLPQFNSNQPNSMKILAFRLNFERLFELAPHKTSAKPNATRASDETKTLKATIELLEELEAGAKRLSAADTDSGRSSSESSSLDQQHALASHQLHRSTSNQTLKHSNMIQSLRPSSSLEDAKVYFERAFVAGAALTPPSAQVNEEATGGRRSGQAGQSSAACEADLSAIDGIKVLSMVWLISAHTLLFFIRTIANGRDFWSILRDARYMTIMAGIFPVDTFFTITGILTAYLKFNKNDGKQMRNLKYWLEAFVHRYLRFMPLYLIVFWYTRDVSEYIGSGPLWDYATADTSLRWMCKQESLTVPLLFQANFKPLQQHCIKPAWYLANDYQYLLITPLFVALLMKSKLLGYTAIGISILASLVMQFLTVFYSKDLDDPFTLINFKPMFGAYVLKNLWKLYVLPYNRIPPYLIGLATGHMMYNLSKSTREQLTDNSVASVGSTPTNKQSLSRDSMTSIQTNQSHQLFNSRSSSDILSRTTTSIKVKAITTEDTVKSSGSLGAFGSYICIKIWTPLVFLISIIYLPMLTRISTTQESTLAKVGTSSIIALMRFVWSIAIARLIYICATRFMTSIKEFNNSNSSDSVGQPIGSGRSRDNINSFIIRFLSSPRWKPWSKVGLSALLIQWEIIGYLAQAQLGAPNMTLTFLIAIILLCIVATYTLALLIYLTIEFPLSQVEHLYIHPTLFEKARL